MARKDTIQSIAVETRRFDPPKELSQRAWIKNMKEYREMYERSVKDPDRFWGDAAKEFVWFDPWKKVRSYDFKDKIDIKYFEGGKTNISVNCLDRHIEAGRGDRVAILWEGNEPGQTQKWTYRQLYSEVCKFANVLKSKGVKKGDRISIYLPMITQLPIAMLACARIGAVHNVVFGGFSADSLRDRILDSGCEVLITSDEGSRGAKRIPMKETADAAMAACEKAGRPVKTCVVFKYGKGTIPMKGGRDFWWHELMASSSPTCIPEIMDAEDPLFILYTSGSTGKPKGVLHTTGGYMVFTALTFKYIFDYHDDDIFWCTADIGWVTGHSYIVYGPLALGATEVMFEGIPNYPKPDRFWEICEKHGVTIFYTAPTAIRALMREGEEWPKKHDLSKLRVLGSVGEPINPEAWIWYYKNIGGEQCPIVDTWWQTETGGILITPLPGAVPTKPGSATVPFFGVVPKIFNESGQEVGVNEGGYLVITEPWPGIMRTVYGQHERFKETYFVRFPGVYLTGDGARKDEDGYFWLMGRIDDVLNVSGHRIGTAEIESALVSHPSVAEAAVVGFPHEIKGEGIYAFVVLKRASEHEPERIHSGRLSGASDTPSAPPMGVSGGEQDLTLTLKTHVRKEIGPIAMPDKLQFADALPKTRSGKIMRRILRKIAEGEVANLGDTTTLADPQVVGVLVEGRQ